MTRPPAQGEPHPLAAFKPRAVVDWVIIRFTTPRPTQYQHLRNRMPPEWRAHAKPIGKNTNSCREWLLTIQDPPHASAIARVLRGQGVDPFDVGIEALELAIDWYPRSQEARAELARAAHHLVRHLACPPSGTPRTTEPGHYRAAARPRDTLRALSDGFTVNMGAQEANHCARFYVKRHDSGQAGAYRDLPEAQHRARGEVTLSGEALPIKTLADLASFKFEALAKYLHQRKVTTPKTQAGALYRQEVQQWGRPIDAKKRASRRRQSSRATEADSTANEWIYNALRGLTRARKNAEIPAFFAPMDNRRTEGEGGKSADSPKYLKENQDTHHPADPPPTADRPCTPNRGRPDRGSPWWIRTTRFHRTYKHFETGMGVQREQISHPRSSATSPHGEAIQEPHRQVLHVPPRAGKGGQVQAHARSPLASTRGLHPKGRDCPSGPMSSLPRRSPAFLSNAARTHARPNSMSNGTMAGRSKPTAATSAANSWGFAVV